MTRVIWTAILAFAVALAAGPVVLPWLKKMKLRQTIYALGPQSHQKKQGTPTMGGTIFTIAALVACLILSIKKDMVMLAFVLVSALGFGLVGFADDMIKVIMKRNLGLTPKQKMIPQILLSIGLSCWAYFSGNIGSTLYVPFLGTQWDLSWVYIPIMVFVMVGTVNSANLLDGLDGLLSGCSMLDFTTMAIVCCVLAGKDPANSGNYINVAIFGAAMAGALLGFLNFNFYPANTFMGDIGAFFIGGALVGMTTVTRMTLLLPMIALAMVLSSLSDIIQISYFKATHGKRIFKMAPLHHHFELSGMKETKIIIMYYCGTALLCLIALTGFVA